MAGARRLRDEHRLFHAPHVPERTARPRPDRQSRPTRTVQGAKASRPDGRRPPSEGRRQTLLAGARRL